MREFKNEKARELYLKSLSLDEWIDKKEKENRKTGVIDDYIAETGCYGSYLRVLADDMEDGLIDEEELDR